MNIEKELIKRADSKCELCAASDNLSSFLIPTATIETVGKSILVCNTCKPQLQAGADLDVNHWRCLNDSMWSTVPAVQVMAWRMLHRLKAEGWPQDLLDMLYLDEDTLQWAEETGEHLGDEDKVIHRDSNGVQLKHGDSIFLIKDLNVKGSTLTAKRGTAVRNISLVHDNANQIEGRVSGQMVVLLTQYVKKS